jgi:signal transduction histidine kinase/ligand-binding sensor domain-containing protein/uncharacterized membrane-anchored protein YhcB (DUF1043 family)
MNKIIITILFILLGIISSQSSVYQGFPYVKNFTPAEYGAHTQNFAVVSDADGMVYVGNFAGVLQYDGVTWRRIPTANTTKVSALAICSKGNVYVGARGEIGVLLPDESGHLRFKSLIPETQVDIPDFGEIGNVFCYGDEMHFVARRHILSYKDDQIHIWEAPDEISGSWNINEMVYLQIREMGLFVWSDRDLVSAETGSSFAGAIEIKEIFPFNESADLIITGTQGMFLLENGNVDVFQSAVNDFLVSNIVTCAEQLSDGSYAFGTLRQGLVIIDTNGAAVQWIDRDAGLRNNFVHKLYASGGNTLWAALNNGISLIETPAQLSFFNEDAGLEGEVNQALRHNNTMYVATYQGLYYFDKESNAFKSVRGIMSSCWSILPFDDSLLAATSQGVYLVDNQRAVLINDDFTLSLLSCPVDPDKVYAGGLRRFFTLNRDGESWTTARIGGSNEEIAMLHHDPHGNIWGHTLNGNVFRYVPGSRAPRYFTTADGLPLNTGNAVCRVDDNILIYSLYGVFVYNEDADEFEKTSLDIDIEDDAMEWYSFIIQNEDASLWVNDGDETGVRLLIKDSETYRSYMTPFYPIANTVVRDVFSDADGVTWFGSPEGVIRYNPSVTNNNTLAAHVLIRQITVNNDSVIFAGAYKGLSEDDFHRLLYFDYDHNSIRFDFSMPYYHPMAGNLYRGYLEGFDDGWSDWSMQPFREYTNLPPGKYRFHVRGKNLYDNVTEATSLGFEVLSPWYVRLWAMIVYVLLIGAVIYGIVRLRNRKLMKEKRILEQTIATRTAEVVEQKEEIERQSRELANKNDELEKINNAVKSINAEINFENLLQSLLEKMKIVRAVENALALVHDKSDNRYKYKASIGWEIAKLEPVTHSFEEAEAIYLQNEEEVFEDIFVKRDFSDFRNLNLNVFENTKSMLVLVIKIENKIEAFLIFENRTRENAFEPGDISFIKNAKEHINSAFIRTRILEDLQETLDNLKDTQTQLIQSEKLASLGELTAGIAHEIQNPLNFVNNFSNLSAELTDEVIGVVEEIKEKLTENQYLDAREVLDMIKGNVEKIYQHGKRAESIVKGMLQHSRGKTEEYELTDINNLVTEYVNLAYHGMRARQKDFNTAINTQLDPEVGQASIIPQDLSRVVLNIVNNACYALDEKNRRKPPDFKPEVLVSTRKLGKKIEIRVKDNGTGIPQHVIDKIFNPFFTTKPSGKGTGLGLSMSYDIVTKMHQGTLEVQSKEGEYTEFIITIPEKQS